jgi:fermentation-respiration switch protein FrsA (DUF1100 family)
MAAPLTRDRPSAHDRVRAVGTARAFCLVVGPALALNGVLGLLLAGAEFDTGDRLPRHEWNFFFQFNGWHEALHVATGTLLTVASLRGSWAARGALAFGLIYAALTPLAFIDGDDVLNVVFSDTPDNFVHALLGIAGVTVGLADPGRSTRARSPRRSPRPRPRLRRGARR